MAKVKCYRPDGEMVMKEPVDARECVENCGFTMEAPEDNTIKLVRKDPPDEVITAVTDAMDRDIKIDVIESEGTGEIMEEVKEEIVAPKIDGRKNRKNRNR